MRGFLTPENQKSWEECSVEYLAFQVDLGHLFKHAHEDTQIEPENLVILEGLWPHDTETTQGFIRGTVEALPSTGARSREYTVQKRKGWSRFTRFGVLHIS